VTFANAEFQTDLSVNSRGFRDDEASLKDPEIVVLGDSYAMGWGVQQREAFPALLERESGRRVLNAATPSYGTAREVESLLRLGSLNPQVVIVQYCPNDLEENRLYVSHGFKLTPMTRGEYAEVVETLRPPDLYLPGRYLARMLDLKVVHRLPKLFTRPARLAGKTEPAPDSQSPADAADLFLRILKHGGVFSTDRLVVVLEIDAFRTIDDGFLRAVEQQAAAGGLNLRIVDLSKDLRPEHYFRLDDHLKARSPGGRAASAPGTRRRCCARDSTRLVGRQPRTRRWDLRTSRAEPAQRCQPSARRSARLARMNQLSKSLASSLRRYLPSFRRHVASLPRQLATLIRHGRA